MQNNKPKVVIIGRENVGKSTLFNRLTETKKAMVSEIGGTTRDLKRGNVEWSDIKFDLTDTGGFMAHGKSPLQLLNKKKFSEGDIDRQVEKQAMRAIKESDLVILLLDAKTGLNPIDREALQYLKKTEKNYLIVVNKCDSEKDRAQVGEFYKLGIKEIQEISASASIGIGDLLDKIKNNIKKTNKEEVEEKTKDERIRVAIIGKPNVGKSTLFNSIAEEERSIVSDIAHTTREPNDVIIKHNDQELVFIDTAGLRHKSKIERKSLEHYGVRMSLGVLKTVDVTIFVIDANEKISHQDMQIGKLIADAGTSVIIVGNKYDQLKEIVKEEKDITKKMKDYIYYEFPHLKWAPIIFTSASTGRGVKKILDKVLEVYTARNITISDNALGKFLKTLIRKQPPPRKKIGFGRRTKIKRAYITHIKQISSSPPTFSGTVGSKEKLPEEYRRYLMNNIRQKFGFEGTPIKLIIKRKEETDTEERENK